MGYNLNRDDISFLTCVSGEKVPSFTFSPFSPHLVPFHPRCPQILNLHRTLFPRQKGCIRCHLLFLLKDMIRQTLVYPKKNQVSEDFRESFLKFVDLVTATNIVSCLPGYSWAQ